MTAERPEHVDGVREVETRSFPTEGEAFLVDRLRANGNLTISLVALASASGQVVGHVALSPVVSADGEEGIAIGPIAVTPSHQNRGVGSALMERSISEATDQGYRWVVLLGDPNWYSRFGFGPASRHGLVDQWGGGDAFQIRELVEGGAPSGGGLVRYSSEFDELED